MIGPLTPLLQIFDMPTSIAFYRDVLGCEVIATSGPGDDYYWAMLKLGSATLMLNTAYDDDERPPQPEASRVASHDDTVLYFACERPDEMYALLCKKGWPAQPPADSYYGMRQVYTHDPDGFQICFQCPIPSPHSASGAAT